MQPEKSCYVASPANKLYRHPKNDKTQTYEMQTLWYKNKAKSTDSFFKLSQQMKKSGTFGHTNPFLKSCRMYI